MRYYYGFDLYYLILVMPAIILAAIAQFKVHSAFKKYSKVLNKQGTTGYQAAQCILQDAGITDVRVERTSQKGGFLNMRASALNDHYDPRNKVIYLSDSVYNEASIAAVSVAAHEAGHAVQYQTGYAPVRIRGSLFPLCNFSTYAAFPLAILGIIMSIPALITIGIWLYTAVVAFQIVTLPVEFNASARAMTLIQKNNLLSPGEIKGGKNVLGAAALTYVAAMLMTLMNLLRLILMAKGRD